MCDITSNKSATNKIHKNKRSPAKLSKATKVIRFVFVVAVDDIKPQVLIKLVSVKLAQKLHVNSDKALKYG